MDGHERVLTMTNEEFRQQVALLDAAFANHAAAFFFDGDAGNAIDVFDFFEGLDDLDDWVELRAFSRDAYQLIFFALEDAPSSVVRSWSNDHGQELGDVGVERVGVIRQEMLHAYDEWQRRYTDLGPTLGDLKVTHVYDEDLEQPKTVIRVDSYFVEGLRKVPSASSRQYVSAALTRNELRRLIDRLRMADIRYERDDAEEGAANTESEGAIDGG